MSIYMELSFIAAIACAAVFLGSYAWGARPLEFFFTAEAARVIHISSGVGSVVFGLIYYIAKERMARFGRKKEPWED